MLVGYNTNISYKGTVYHVQTEDSGVKNPVIVTLLYLKGSILASKKTSYSDLLDEPDFTEKLQSRMKEQHKTMMKELIAGKHTGETSAESEKDVLSSTGATDNIDIETCGSKLKIETGSFDIPEIVKPPDKPQEVLHSGRRIEKSLDEVLLEFLSKKEKKKR